MTSRFSLSSRRMELPSMELNRVVGLHEFFSVELSAAPLRGPHLYQQLLLAGAGRREGRGQRVLRVSCFTSHSRDQVLYYVLSHFFSMRKTL